LILARALWEIMPTLRAGIDLVEISRLETLYPAIRRRFLERVFTPQELADAQDRFDTLCGRFAAKEAVVKALGSGIGPVAWQDIEILRGVEGEPQLQLHGEARRWAAALGLENWSISISHTREYAVAVAVGAG
jgi:holo-[acyl-carrier protein] synthase